MRLMSSLLLSAVLLAPPARSMQAQSPTPGGHVAPAAALDAMLAAVEHDVVPAAKAMPADKYDFAPSASAFAAGSPEKFDTVRSFGKQVAHLAQANYFFFAGATGMKPDADVKAIGSMTKKDDLVAALEKSFEFAHKAAATMTDASAFEAVKPIDGQTTRFTIGAFAVAHAYDHYGQMVEYLRMNGIIPPSSQR